MSDTFEVAGILGKRSNKGVTEYRIEWKGYSVEDATWEPIDSLSSIKGIIDAYQAKTSKFEKGLMHADSKKGKLKDKMDDKRRINKKSTKFINNEDSSEVDDSKRQETRPRLKQTARRSSTPSPEKAKPETESFALKLSERLKKSVKAGESKKKEDEKEDTKKEKDEKPATKKLDGRCIKKDETYQQQAECDRVEVLKMIFKQGERRRVMEVRIGDKIKEMPLQTVHSSYPKALCLYYERILRIDP